MGIPVAQIDLQGLFAYVRAAISAGDTSAPNPRVLAYINAHSCNLFHADPTYREALLQADLVYTDGNGPRVAAWMAGDHLPPRMTGADWINDLCELSQHQNLRLYFLGASPGVAEAARHKLQERHRGLSVVGVHHGYFTEREEPAILREIEHLRPDILLVGMASPRQETWMIAQASRLTVPLVWGAGGVFDYASGELSRAPLWMRKLALEWLGRLLIEPRRLAPRYLAGMPRFMARSTAFALRRWLRRTPIRFRP